MQNNLKHNRNFFIFTTLRFSVGISLVSVVANHNRKPQFKLQMRKLVFIWHKPWLFLFLCDCRSAENLLRPPNAIIPFPLSESNLSGPVCYPVSSQIARSPVNAFILSPPCLCSDTLFSSDSIKNHNFGSWGSDQIGQLMHFSCILIFFSMYLIFTYRLSIYQSAF